MKIGVIGSGISSLASAYYLKKEGHEISLFESGDYFGGHTNTVDYLENGKRIPVDTGFLVFNNLTYPNLINFFNELGIESYDSDMSLSVQSLKDNVCWNGSDFKGLLSQKRNLISLRFYRMLYDIIRFNNKSKSYLDHAKSNPGLTLGELIGREKYSREFIDWYLVPMSASIWSTPPSKILDFPAHTFLTFSINHCLLQVFDRPVWKTVKGGSREYVRKVIPLLDKASLNEPALEVIRNDTGLDVITGKGRYSFDMVISGVHAPANLKIVKDLSSSEKEVLSAFNYQDNPTYLHTDTSFLPENKKAWASWNYVSTGKDQKAPVSVSYLINKLQHLETDTPLIVTLNPHRGIREDKIIKKINYDHPVFDTKALMYQGLLNNIQGIGGLYYVGAWQRYGFHEDGIRSALNAVELIKSKHSEESYEMAL